ncbi:hypothetical protein [Geoanaerobacter pelophilus]|uniref:hypothetical protein n=1 Tax=Geoanaerobacter pelophilus TaxID=60036 RepID=UPI000A2695D3|nr:hypothetical protein [Geoanaerobacter pelophilus]
MKQLLVVVLLMTLIGCGGSGTEAPAQFTTYAGTWGYDDATTKIRLTVLAPGPAEVTYPGPSGQDITTIQNVGYHGTGTITRYGDSGATDYSIWIHEPSGPEYGWLGGQANWGVNVPEVDMVVTPVDMKSLVNLTIQNGYAGMSTTTYTLTRR